MDKGFKQQFESFLKSKDDAKEFHDRQYYLDETTQEAILKIQDQKQVLVDLMHEKFRAIDEGKEIGFEKFARTVTSENSKLYLYKKGGVRESVSRGDIAVAYKNGFDIQLDASVDRATKKLYVMSEVRSRIKSLYDEQLITAELDNKNRSPHDPSYRAYEALAEEESRPVYEGRPYGKMAETMVESFMIKFIVDHPNLPFTIEATDVYDDVRKKIDFKIHLKQDYIRGVRVGTHELEGFTGDTGIQFTLNQSAHDHKQEQIARAKENMQRHGERNFDDLVLVSIPLNDIKEKVDSWNALGKDKTLGGPADLWNQETKKLIFSKMLEKLPQHLDIDSEKLWNESLLDS